MLASEKVENILTETQLLAKWDVDQYVKENPKSHCKLILQNCTKI